MAEQVDGDDEVAIAEQVMHVAQVLADDPRPCRNTMGGEPHLR